MTTSAAEIETIIRVVMQRLRAVQVAPNESNSVSQPTSHNAVATLNATQNAIQRAAPNATTDLTSLRLNIPLVTLEQLNGRLDGIRVVEVPQRAVVTPAVVDELRRRNILLKRDSVSFASASQASSHAAVLIVAPQNRLSKKLASLKADEGVPCTGSAWARDARTLQLVESADLSANIRAILTHIGSVETGIQSKRVIWCSPRPFAAALATTNQPLLRAAQLSSINDLPLAVEQVQPNVLITDQRHWSSASIANLMRAWRVQG